VPAPPVVSPESECAPPPEPPVFATTVTRDAAFGGAGEKVLAEGQFAYVEADDTLYFYDGSVWAEVSGGVAGDSDQLVLGSQIFS